MRNYQKEKEKRVEFIRQALKSSGASGIVYGNSGGKDSALVGILCKAACENTLGLIMPCSSKRNFQEDKEDGMAVARQFQIETRVIDLSQVKEAQTDCLSQITQLSPDAMANLAPRLRMATLYAVAASEHRLVAGTGNASEAYMGYFTKWGDGACDFNPIADLTVTEIYEFLEYLDAPKAILEKAPSAGLYDGQTDEKEMGITYQEIDEYLLNGTATEQNRTILQKYHRKSQHKRSPILRYPGQESLSSRGA